MNSDSQNNSAAVHFSIMNSARYLCRFNCPRLSGIGLRQLLLLFAALVLAAACTGKVKEQPILPGSHVLAPGDSLTEGTGVTPQEAWPNLLGNRTGWVVINGGVSGDTSGAALQRLPSLLEEHAPVLVLVTLGGNDMLHHLPQQETIANLEKTIALIKAHGAQPVLLATPNPSLIGAVFRHLSAAEFYQQVADTQHVPLIKDAISKVISDPLLKGDPLHPNAAGHVRLAAIIYAELKSIGYAR